MVSKKGLPSQLQPLQDTPGSFDPKEGELVSMVEETQEAVMANGSQERDPMATAMEVQFDPLFVVHFLISYCLN